MATQVFEHDVNSSGNYVTTNTTAPSSWQDSRATVGGESSGVVKRQRLASEDSSSSYSSDGYLRLVERSNTSSPDLNSVNTANNGGRVGESQSKPSNGISILAAKYILFPEAPLASGRRMGGSSSKTEMSCVNIKTKEQFSCKIVPRSPKGLSMLAAYHRLDESTDFVNQVIEAILTPKVLYLIMPKHYGNVHSYLLEKRTLDETEAANIFKQMVEAVHHCHSRGIILRDVKMGRFVFVDKSKSKIKLESLEDASLLLDPSNDNLEDKFGCPNYVSPEKAETLKTNLKYPGKAADIWCLGVILYTMLSGRYPFNDPNQAKLLNKIRAGNFIIPPGLSPSVSFLIKTLLRKSPAERPSCSEILRSPWLRKHCKSTQSVLTIEVEVEPIKKDDALENTQTQIQQHPSTFSQHKFTAPDQVVPNF